MAQKALRGALDSPYDPAEPPPVIRRIGSGDAPEPLAQRKSIQLWGKLRQSVVSRDGMNFWFITPK